MHASFPPAFIWTIEKSVQNPQTSYALEGFFVLWRICHYAWICSPDSSAIQQFDRHVLCTNNT